MMKKLKILIVTHYYPPEIGAPQARLSEMAQIWKEEGHDVSVLTCFPNHPTGEIPKDYQGQKSMVEVIKGIRIKRCWVYATPNKGFLKKLINHLSFMVTAVIQGHREAKGVDIIIGSSPTFFSIISVYILSMMYRIPFVFEVRDLWPAIFKELDIIKNKTVLAGLESIELFLYRKASLVVPVTDAFADDIESRGIPKEKIAVFKNGVNIDVFSPKPYPESLAKELRLENKFIVLYIGAHGISHALDTILYSAQKLKDHLNIHFLFVGEGAEKAQLQNLKEKLELTNVTFLPGQDKEKVADFYAMMDIGLVPLRNIPLFKSFIPSKMFEIMGMGKPIVGSVEGESALILQASGAAKIGPPENVDTLVENILYFYKNKEKLVEFGDRGLTYVQNYFNRKKIAQAYVSRLEEILQRSGG